MYDILRSKHRIVKELSDYQIQILLFLQLGYFVSTTEGANYRVWLHDKTGTQVSFPVRKDTMNALFSVGLLTQCTVISAAIGSYTLSNKAVEVLALLDNRKRAANSSKINRVLSSNH